MTYGRGWRRDPGPNPDARETGPGVIGTLGYPGYFPVGDTQALARLLHRAETDAPFYEGLKRWCRKRAHLVAPMAERKAWAGLLCELRPG